MTARGQVGQQQHHHSRRCKPRRLALAAAACCLAGGAQAVVVLSGDSGSSAPFLDVAGVTTVNGSVHVGRAADGAFSIDSGTRVSVWQLVLANSASTGKGTVSVSGAGSALAITRANGTNFDLGGFGTGLLSVLGGASLRYGDQSDNCVLNCRTFIGNAAGSSGTLQVDGAGSSFTADGRVVIGQTSVFSTAVGDSLNWGRPGASTSSQVTVSGGATARANQMFVGSTGNISLASTGTEFANGSLVIDGAGSAWNLVRHAAQTGSQSLLIVGNGRNTSGTVAVRNGGALRLDGTAVADQYSGLVLGTTATGTSNGTGTLLVTGAGSFVEFAGGRSFLNVGNTPGGTGYMTISGGGRVVGAGDGDTGLTYVNIGRNGGVATATVTGADSLLRLNGRQSAGNLSAGSVPLGGAYLMVGRTDGTAAGQGTLNVLDGGQVVIDTRALALTNPDGQTGFSVGWDAGARGDVTVSGAGSALRVMAGSGLAPYVAVGRNGGTGQLTVSNGGVVELTSPHISQPNPGTYLPGDLLLLDIGRRTNALAGASNGTVTVTGAGSRLTLGGGVDALVFVGRGAETLGTLNITAGGLVQATGLAVGDRGNGIVNIQGGRLETGATFNGGPNAGEGGGIAVGRGDGVGTLNLSAGAVVQVHATAPRSGLRIAGNALVPGGTGTVTLSGGSVLDISGPQASLTVASYEGGSVPSVGILNLVGAGNRVTVAGSGAKLSIGAAANAVGTVVVGAGSLLQADGFVSVAHDGLASTAGTGTLVVNGDLTTGTLFNGANGLVGGSGSIHADVVNLGTINPGNSPGRLQIDGKLDTAAGTLVLEVQYDAATNTWLHDELVLGPTGSLALGHGRINFSFLPGSDPSAFLAQGLLDLDTFFKVDVGQGQLAGISSTPLLAHAFDEVQFSGQAGDRVLNAFTLDTRTGELGAQVSAVPAPPAWALLLLGLGWLLPLRRR